MHRYSEFNIKTLNRQEMLNKFLTIAPLHHNYALCIEYTKHWFLEKFNKDFFSYIHLDGAHAFGELTRLTKDQIISHSNNDKGEVIILPQIDEAYDREHIDMNLFGIDQYIDTTLKIDKAFLQDPINHKYLLMKMDMILMNFTFKIKMPSRATQLDLYKYMKLAFRIGLSESKNVDSDYLIPYPLMLSIASDCGFIIENDRIKEPIKFLTYLNSRSFIPIIYKRSNVNDKEEYFVRVDRLPVRIGLESLTKDDGNKNGHISTDFGIEMTINVRFPSMQLFVYYTKSIERFIPQSKEVYNIDNTLMMALHQMQDPPPVNDKSWNLYIKTDWQADDYGHLHIDMNDLFEGELRYMIEKHKDRFVSPDLFMEVQLYNNGFKQPVIMDWSNMILQCENNHLTKLISTIAIYVDMNYLNTQRIEKYDSNRSRVDYSTPPLK